jgi:hypothetical protein
VQRRGKALRDLVFRTALGRAADLAGAGARASWVEATRAAVFEGNAREVYGLD